MADVDVTDNNFNSEVIESEMPVLVDFWAEWCAPCRIQDPILKELSKSYKDKIKVAKLNVDENPSTASKYGIMSIPTLMFFNQGKSIKQFIGVQSKEILESEFEKVIS